MFGPRHIIISLCGSLSDSQLVKHKLIDPQRAKALVRKQIKLISQNNIIEHYWFS